MNFFKKILLVFFIGICLLLSRQASYAIVKINDVSFDNSNSFLFLSTGQNQSSQINSLNSTILKNPDRVFFDIEDAVMTLPAISWIFKNSNIKQVKVSQFSTNPNIVRVVFYLSGKFNPKDISVIDVNGNYLFRINPMHVAQSNISTVFTDEKSSAKTAIEPIGYYDEPEDGAQVSSAPSSPITSFSDLSKRSSAEALSKSSAERPLTDKNTKLRTKYYLSRIDVKRGHMLVSGIGNISLQNPIYLTNPSRVVFDLPDTVVSPKFKNVEIQISEKEILKIGQFEPTKVRLVIVSEEPDVYRPIFSQDMQSVLISNDTRMSGITLFDKSVDIMSFAVSAPSPAVQTLNVKFSAPVIHSIKKDANKTEIDFYNVLNPNFTSFANAIRSTFFQSTKSVRSKSVGIKYIIPTKNTTVDYSLSMDSKELQISLTKHAAPAPTPIPKQDPAVINACPLDADLIIIDPGHGGSDTGALRAGINEKDINLQISKMVAQILTQKGYKVDMTRWDDKTVSLAERVDFSDCKNAGVFVSIHTNSSVKTDAEGIETHYWTNEGYELAKCVHPFMSKKVCAIDRGLFKSRFYVINHTKAKSILVEVGFISNDKERNQLLSKDRQRKTAEGIADGIDEFIKMDNKGKK